MEALWCDNDVWRPFPARNPSPPGMGPRAWVKSRPRESVVGLGEPLVTVPEGASVPLSERARRRLPRPWAECRQDIAISLSSSVSRAPARGLGDAAARSE